MFNVTERESTVSATPEGPEQSRLRLGPSWLYPLKAGATHARSALWLARTRGRGPAGEPGARILFYHRVSDDPDVLAVRPRRFAAQMELVAEHGLRCVDVAELGRRLAEGEPTESLVGLSFDDGYLDVAEHAVPALERLGFTGTVFLATALTSGEAPLTWYDRPPPLIPWELARRLDGGVLRFEAHTQTHPNLLQVDEARAREEIAGGKAELEAQLGRRVDAFCYPAGLFGPRERRLVAEAGFRIAVSCEPGLNTSAVDPLALHRVQVDRSDLALDFRAKLLGGHDTPLPLRAAWRRRRLGAG
jgi:peptidoglycan/xylan/chitin deacetylase (PgdA/CDA1 family)